MASPQGFHENWLVLKDGRLDMVGLRADWGATLAGEVLFADVLLLPNGMSKVGAYT